MTAETLFPPLPSELVVPFAGSLVAEGRLNALGVLAASTGGALLGCACLYGLGRKLGEARLRVLVRRHGHFVALSEGELDRALMMFRRHARGAVLWARLVPGLRSVISLPAGLARMGLITFLLWSALGTLVWNAALLSAGVLLGHNWPALLAVVDRYELALWLTVGVLGVAWAGRLWRRRKTRPV